ncbi:MAG: bifunctional oligoribonuclease/PAP phosphatase NrnA [Corynebacterium glucuronolyticum]|nr:bifunctional oligoribonuclease/PAP phosphatase NrnA [Corynebacterium glucuronolyticum]
MFTTFAEQFAQELDRLVDASSVAVVGHVRPDGDAIGSVTALVAMLRQKGVNAHGFIGQEERFSKDLYTIPGADDVRTVAHFPDDVSAVVTVDCASIDRTGTLQDEIAALDKTVVIDHHASNTNFGYKNFVIAESEATAVMLYYLIDALDVELTKDIAHSLYAGVLTDTGSFRWGGSSMHEVASKLVATGIDQQAIAYDLVDRITTQDLRFNGQILSNLQVLEAGDIKIASLTAPYELINGRPKSTIESLINFVRATDDTDMGCVFKEQRPGQWTVSLRSRTLDVSRFAIALGGGGHEPAAGYSDEGTIDELIEHLITAVTDHS